MNQDTKYCVVVAEETIEAAADFFGEEENSFARLILATKEFKDAGLTPLYLLNTEDKSLIVVAVETYQKKLH
jgi:hypothetical protein